MVCLKCFPNAKGPGYTLPPEVVRAIEDGEDAEGLVAYVESTTSAPWNHLEHVHKMDTSQLKARRKGAP